MCWAILILSLTGAGWRDDFSSPHLNPRWQWRCPVPGPTLSLTARPGWVRVTLPQRPEGYNHWLPGARTGDAPMLVAAAPAVDFDFEAHLRLVGYGPTSNFHTAMMLGFSPGYVLAWGPFRAPSLGRPAGDPELWCEPTGTGGFLTVAPPADDLFLRIERRGETCSVFYRRAGTSPGETGWTRAGEYHAFAEPTFVGFLGKTFGGGETVVFEVDYAALTPTDQAMPLQPATLTVAFDGRRWPLDERRFAHFIEHMHRCIQGGLWAEKLHNRKFTGASSGGVVEGWRAIGDKHARFSVDNANWYVPCQSQHLVLPAEGWAGIAQGPLGMRGVVPHDGYLIATARPGGVPVRISLSTEGTPLGEATVGPVGKGGFARYRFRLPALPRTTQVEISITARGPGQLWLGAVSLMPADNVYGWRREVIETVRSVRPPMIRWPGGNFASQYDWRDGLGDRDRRPPRWNRAWNHWEWNDVGTDEFLQLCELLGAEPYICANAGEGSAREAAEWVEYCNGPADSPMGRLRAAGGHPEPYGVRFWGLGNEMYGSWQHGYLDATRYGIKALEMARAMRAVDGALTLVLVGVEGSGWGEWNRKVTALAGRVSDYLSVHHYTGLDVNADALAEYSRAIAAPVNVERTLQETWEIARRANGGLPIPLCFDEWNIARQERDDLPGHKGFYSLREGLFAAEIFNALNRLGPRAPVACVTQTVNVLGLIRANDTAVAPSPSYWVLKLFRDEAGRVGVPVEYAGPTVDLPGGLRTGVLDASATYDPDTGKLAVFIVNRSAACAREVTVRFSGTTIGSPRTACILAAPSFLAANDYTNPAAVTPRKWTTRPAGDSQVNTLVPPHSLVVIRAPARQTNHPG